MTVEMDTEENTQNLTEEALKRKQRLQRMKDLAAGVKDDKESTDNLPK